MTGTETIKHYGSSTTVSSGDQTYKAGGIIKLSAKSVEVDNIKLNQDLNLNSLRIKNVALPIDGNDVATKAYVDLSEQVYAIKEPVRVATTSTIPAIYDEKTKIFSYLGNGNLIIDGKILDVGDRFLIKDGLMVNNVKCNKFNGIYQIIEKGPGNKQTKFKRTCDFDSSEKIKKNSAINVLEGCTLKGTLFYVSLLFSDSNIIKNSDINTNKNVDKLTVKKIDEDDIEFVQSVPICQITNYGKGIFEYVDPIEGTKSVNIGFKSGENLSWKTSQPDGKEILNVNATELGGKISSDGQIEIKSERIVNSLDMTKSRVTTLRDCDKIKYIDEYLCDSMNGLIWSKFMIPLGDLPKNSDKEITIRLPDELKRKQILYKMNFISSGEKNNSNDKQPKSLLIKYKSEYKITYDQDGEKYNIIGPNVSGNLRGWEENTPSIEEFTINFEDGALTFKLSNKSECKIKSAIFVEAYAISL